MKLHEMIEEARRRKIAAERDAQRRYDFGEDGDATTPGFWLPIPGAGKPQDEAEGSGR